MKKDIKWLKAEVEKQDIVMDKGYIYTSVLIYLIDSLDEPEVLSQEWIDEHIDYADVGGDTNVYTCRRLKSLLVPKQGLPVIPKYVAEYLEFAKEHGSLIKVMELASISGGGLTMKKEYDWISANDETFARAWLGGYEVEEKPLYYALIKGHELIAGEDACKYWKCDMRNGGMFLSNRYSHYGRYLAEMSKLDWIRLGINDSNADFIEVEE